MKKTGFILLCFLMTGCTSNKLLEDIPSPQQTYHVEVLQCQQNGSFWGTEKFQVSVLKTGVSEKCQSVRSSYISFDSAIPISDLELEWLSDTLLRAWHPNFNLEYGPNTLSTHSNSPVQIIFKPKE